MSIAKQNFSLFNKLSTNKPKKKKGPKQPREDIAIKQPPPSPPPLPSPENNNNKNGKLKKKKSNVKSEEPNTEDSEDIKKEEKKSPAKEKKSPAKEKKSPAKQKPEQKPLSKTTSLLKNIADKAKSPNQKRKTAPITKETEISPNQKKKTAPITKETEISPNKDKNTSNGYLSSSSPETINKKEPIEDISQNKSPRKTEEIQQSPKEESPKKEEKGDTPPQSNFILNEDMTKKTVKTVKSNVEKPVEPVRVIKVKEADVKNKQAPEPTKTTSTNQVTKKPAATTTNTTTTTTTQKATSVTATTTPNTTKTTLAAVASKLQPNAVLVKNVITKSIATNTEAVVTIIPKKVETKSVETSTSDLIQQEKHKETDDKISSKIIVIPTSKTTQGNTWKPHERFTADTIIPPTPEGPRFLQEGTQLTYTHPGVQAEMLQKMHTYQTQGLMCDVFLRVDGIDFKAHKVVLAASSPYFQELFYNKNVVRIDRLILEGLKPQSVAAMLGYFYMAKLIIDAEDVEDLLDSAYYFKTMEVVKLCTDYLEVQLSIHNCFTFYHIAIRHNIDGLRIKTFRYICWNFKSIVKERRFLEIDGEVVLQIISSKQVKVKSEEEIYESVWMWFIYNKVDRGFFIPKLVMHIHFELMELEYLEEKVKKQMYLESELCRKKVNDAINLVNNKIDTDTRQLSLFRQASDNVYLFAHSPATTELLDLITCKSERSPELQLPPPMIDIDCHVTVKAGRNLYTLSKSKVSCFNVSNLNWEYFCPGIPIYEAGICCTKTSIFVAGGKPNGKQFYELNLLTKQWNKLPDMEMDRRSPAIASMGNTKPRIFVAGGFSLSKSCVLDTMAYYVVSEKVWKTIKQSMSVARLQPSMIVHVDKVYVVGGRNEEKTHTTMDIFERSSQKWIKNNCQLSESKVDPCLVMFEAKIYCIGGIDCTTIEVLEEVDSKRKWNIVGKLNKPKSNVQCVVYNPV